MVTRVCQHISGPACNISGSQTSTEFLFCSTWAVRGPLSSEGATAEDLLMERCVLAGRDLHTQLSFSQCCKPLVKAESEMLDTHFPLLQHTRCITPATWHAQNQIKNAYDITLIICVHMHSTLMQMSVKFEVSNTNITLVTGINVTKRDHILLPNKKFLRYYPTGDIWCKSVKGFAIDINRKEQAGYQMSNICQMTSSLNLTLLLWRLISMQN